MKPNKIAEAVGTLFTKGGVTPSAPTNTHVDIPSHDEPKPDHGEKDGDGRLPEYAAGKDDRARVLKEIAERRNAQAVEEGNESIPSSNEDGEIETAPSDEGAPNEDDTVPGDVTPEPQAIAPSASEEMRTIIVDGQQMQVPVSKILEMGTRTLQKEVAADARLNQASQLLAEAKRLAEQPPKGAAEPVDEMTLAEATRLIRYGDDEQATKAMEWFKAQAAPRIDQSEIIKAAREAVGPQLAFETAKSFAQSEYGDILNDPDLGAIFLNRENAARASGDQRGFIDLYKAIGEDIRKKFNRPKPGATAQAKPSTTGRTMAEKQAAKAQAPNAPKLASARLDGDGSEPRPPTRGEIIDRMRRARAFQPYAAQK